MNKLVAFAACVVFAVMSLTAAPALAQTRIIVVDVSRVLDQSKEMTDARTSLAQRATELRTASEQRNVEIEGRQRALPGTFRAGTPEFDRELRAIRELQLRNQLETQVAQEEIDRTNKTTLRRVYDKVARMCEVVAKEQGAQIVLSDLRPPTIDDATFAQLNTNQLAEILGRRVVLYVDPSLDMTSIVISRLDSEYASARPAGQ